MKRKIVVGTRGSKLALVQTESVVSRLKSLHPDLEIGIKKIVTAGDRDRLTHLDSIGVNVFVKELEEALLDGRIDLAVHSLKDVPTDIPKDLILIATPEREEPGDVLVAGAGLNDLRAGSRIGTGSLRRTIQLARIRPDIKACGIRGNVDTRLAKITSGEVDGVILAAAGLKRLGLWEKITEYLPLESFLPAAGQGTMVMEARVGDKDIIEKVLRLNHLPTWQCVTAERAFLRELGGGCRAPIAALGRIEQNILKLQGMAASPGGDKLLRETVEGDVESAEELGMKLAGKMLNMGVAEFIAEARRNETR